MIGPVSKSSETSPASTVSKSTNASSGSTLRKSVALAGRSRGLSVSRALRGVVGVLGRGEAAPRRGLLVTVESGRGFDFDRGLASVESAALYFLVDWRSGVELTELGRGRRPMRDASSVEVAAERGRLDGVDGIEREGLVNIVWRDFVVVFKSS